jgi:hypothetical protein
MHKNTIHCLQTPISSYIPMILSCILEPLMKGGGLHLYYARESWIFGLITFPTPRSPKIHLKLQRRSVDSDLHYLTIEPLKNASWARWWVQLWWSRGGAENVTNVNLSQISSLLLRSRVRTNRLRMHMLSLKAIGDVLSGNIAPHTRLSNGLRPASDSQHTNTQYIVILILETLQIQISICVILPFGSRGAMVARWTVRISTIRGCTIF